MPCLPYIFVKLFIYLFERQRRAERKRERERERENLLSTGLLPQVGTTPRTPVEVRSQALHPGLAQGCQGPKHLGHLPLPSQDGISIKPDWQEAGSEAE